jgi:hypothetical protein
VRLHWDGLDNPEKYIGSYEEKLAMERELCNNVEKRVDEFVQLSNLLN